MVYNFIFDCMTVKTPNRDIYHKTDPYNLEHSEFTV